MPRYMDFEYSRIDSGIRIDKYTGSAKSVTIPSRIDNLPVISIGNDAFNGCSALMSITIPDSVSSIGKHAFSGCESLMNITIPDSVISINRRAFNYCITLKSISIPHSVTSIDDDTFNNCRSLTSIIIPDSVSFIGKYAFNSCTSLKSINIPNSVTSIGNNAFSYCSSLTSITIPDSVSSIGHSTFRGCESLMNITIPDSITSIGNDAFYACKSLTSIAIPDSVTSIGNSTFQSCTSLTEIKLPEGLISIGNNAFNGCSALTSIIIPDSVKSIGNNAFSECSKLKNILIHASNIYINKDAFDNCDSLKITRYNFSPRLFPKNKDFINIELPQLIEQITKLVNSIQRIKSLPLNNLELFKIIRELEALFESKGYSSEFDTAATKILNDVEIEYNRQDKIMSNSTLSTKLSEKVSKLENAPAISAELLALIKQIKNLGAQDYSPELNDYVTKVLADIKIEYNRQDKIISNSTLPTKLSEKVSKLENAPAISAELLALIKQIKNLGAQDYSPELNDYVTKVLADIETEYNRQQEKNYVINLIALVESVSGKQITNTPQYVQKFDNEVADFVSNINATIEALKMKKNSIQNRLSERKHENEDLINATIEVLKTMKNSIQNRLSEQKRENENRIRAEFEALTASLKE